MDLTRIKTIYYRGRLDSCNYTCSYCPFAKRKMSLKAYELDQRMLGRFYERISELKFVKPIKIFLVPYGEAMIHSYYIEAIAKFALLKNVSYVGIQTNLSWSVRNFMDIMEKYRVNLKKVKVWATYHPEMVDENTFINKVESLNKLVEISVGLVALPQSIQIAKKLRDNLPPNVYLWINAKAKSRKDYDSEIVESLKSIDPLFEEQLLRHPAKEDVCAGGDTSVFMTANGDLSACPISKIKIGNIYKSLWIDDVKMVNHEKRKCYRRECDCYLAYCLREDFVDRYRYFGDTLPFRIPQKKAIKAIFADVDGTLTDAEGHISESKRRALHYMVERLGIPLYLVTALPREIAIRRCRKILPLVSGGVYASGADIRLLEPRISMLTEMSSELIEMRLGGIEKLKQEGARIYRKQGKVYRILILRSKVEAYHFEESGIQIIPYKHHVALIHRKASKVRGIQMVCQQLGIDVSECLVMGDGQEDLDMLSSFDLSLIVQNNQIRADGSKSIGTYHMNVDHIPIFFEGSPRHDVL